MKDKLEHHPNDNTPFALVSSALEEKLAEEEILRQSLIEKKQQSEEYFSQLLRLKAEFDNYRKRVEREKKEQFQIGKETVLIKLIGLVDIFEQAINSAKKFNHPESVVSGLELLQKEFLSFLEKEGLKPILTVGQQFDPHCHEAVEQEENTEVKDGTIIAEIQKGYCLEDHVLRVSKVKISKNVIQSQPEKEAKVE